MKKNAGIIIVILMMLVGCSEYKEKISKTEKRENICKSEITILKNESEKNAFDDKKEVEKLKEVIINDEISLKKRQQCLALLVRSYESKLAILTQKFSDNNYNVFYNKQLNGKLDRDEISKIEDKRIKNFFYTLCDGFYKLKKENEFSNYIILLDYNELAEYIGELEGEIYDYIKLMGHLQELQDLLENKNLNFEIFIGILNNIEDYMKRYKDTTYTKKFMEIYKSFVYKFFLDDSYGYFSFSDGEISDEEYLKLKLLVDENEDRLIGKMANQILIFNNDKENFYYNVEKFLYYYKIFGVTNDGFVEEKEDKLYGGQRAYIQFKELDNKSVEREINENIIITMNENIKRHELVGSSFYQNANLSYADENYISLIFRILILKDNEYITYLDTKTYDLKTGKNLSLDEILGNCLRDYKNNLDEIISYKAKYNFLEDQLIYKVKRNQKYYLNSYGIVLLFNEENEKAMRYIHLYYEEISKIIQNEKLKSNF